MTQVSLDTGKQFKLPDAKVEDANSFHSLCLTLSPDQHWLAFGGYSSNAKGETKGTVVLQPLSTADESHVVLRTTTGCDPSPFLMTVR